MNIKILEWIMASLVLTLMGGCGFTQLKYIPAQPETVAITNPDQVGYKEINDAVFTPDCTSCHNQSFHSGGVSLDTYAGIKASLGLVQNEVSGQSMPPDSPLSANQINMVSLWIQNGAPEFATSTPAPVVPNTVTSPTPIPVASSAPVATPSATPQASPSPGATATPAPVGLIATYTSIRQYVFVAKCLSCHSAGLSESRFPLDTYSSMMARSGMIVSRNPNSSSVYTEIANGYMPPSHSSAVTASELSVIKIWILNGAPN